MPYVLEKLIQDLFLAPVGWLLWIFLLALFLLEKGKVVAVKFALLLGLVTLGFLSTNFAAKVLGGSLERAYPVKIMSDYPKSQAIVVLGGSTYGPSAPRLEIEELGGARVLGAARLFKAGKGEWIVVTSGDPYQASDGTMRRESDDMRDLLVEYGVPKEAILTEGASRTTKENAKNTEVLLRGKGVQEILLVTSAYHLTRSVKLFEKAGFKVIAVPTSQEVSNTLVAQDFFPKASALMKSTMYLKEYFGRLVGR